MKIMKMLSSSLFGSFVAVGLILASAGPTTAKALRRQLLLYGILSKSPAA